MYMYKSCTDCLINGVNGIHLTQFVHVRLPNDIHTSAMFLHPLDCRCL